MNFKPDMKKMEANSEQAARFLKSMANPLRLRILCKLLDTETAAGELSRGLDISQANLSQHLTWLKKEKLVDFRREGTVIYYHLSDKQIEPLMNVLYTMFCNDTPDAPQG